MEALWQKGACSVREIQETFPETGRPAYTTVQTVVFGGRAKLVMAHLVESGDLTLADVQEAEKSLRQSPKKDKAK